MIARAISCLGLKGLKIASARLVLGTAEHNQQAHMHTRHDNILICTTLQYIALHCTLRRGFRAPALTRSRHRVYFKHPYMNRVAAKIEQVLTPIAVAAKSSTVTVKPQNTSTSITETLASGLTVGVLALGFFALCSPCWLAEVLLVQLVHSCVLQQK